MTHEHRILTRLDDTKRQATVGRVKPKPDLMAVIMKTLGRDHVRVDAHDYYLLREGRWVKTKFHDVMKAVNRKRLATGYVQITEMREWVV